MSSFLFLIATFALYKSSIALLSSIIGAEDVRDNVSSANVETDAPYDVPLSIAWAILSLAVFCLKLSTAFLSSPSIFDCISVTLLPKASAINSFISAFGFFFKPALILAIAFAISWSEYASPLSFLISDLICFSNASSLSSLSFSVFPALNSLCKVSNSVVDVSPTTSL